MTRSTIHKDCSFFVIFDSFFYYTIRYKKYSYEGTKYYFVCKNFKSCERNCFIFEVIESEYIRKYELFLCTSSCHEHINKDSKSLPHATKEYISHLLKENISNPNQIASIIRKENLPEISKYQINSLLQQLKKKQIKNTENDF